MRSHTKNIFIRISAVLTAALLAVTMPAGVMKTIAASASANIDLSRKGSLTITHKSVDNELMADVPSHLYLVATIDANGQYTITDEFKGCFADQDFFNNGYDYDSWKSCVSYDMDSDTDNLYKYVRNNNIQEADSGVSDLQGNTFYKNLQLGVYYVLSDKVVDGDYTNSFVNFVYPVPILETDSDGRITVNYAPAASPKKSKVKNDVYETLEILKRWEDDGYSAQRPVSIEVQIFCDQEEYKTLTLSESNNWHYTEDVEAGHEWEVVESDPGSGYTGTIDSSRLDNTFSFVITNTYTPPEKPDIPEKPEKPEKPEVPEKPEKPEIPGVPDKPEQPDVPEQPGIPDIPQQPDIPGQPTTPDLPDIPDQPDQPDQPTTPTGQPEEPIPSGQPNPPGVLGAIRNLPAVLGAVRELPAVLGARRLPQTGQLWWPIPVMVLLGIAFIVKGIKKNSRS